MTNCEKCGVQATYFFIPINSCHFDIKIHALCGFHYEYYIRNDIVILLSEDRYLVQQVLES